jgi:hypothetical protein
MPADTAGSATSGDDSLVARSVRFALTVTAPVALNLFIGVQPWLVYALIASIAGYGVDTGGRALHRLAWMAGVGAAILAGAGLGSLVTDHPMLTMAAFAFGGVCYALSESGHQVTLTVARFFCFGIAIGALYAQVEWLDIGVVAGFVGFAWLVSCAWDLFAGRRPPIAPALREIFRAMRARLLDRWTFAIVVALAIPLAFVLSSATGEQKPYWAMLALILVLRVDFNSSRRLMVERFLGTLLGVVVAGLYAALFPNHIALMIGLVLAALARWPAQQKHGALGVGALTVFVMLMIELVVSSRGQALVLLEARVVNTAIGCGVALLALGLDRALHGMARRITGGAPVV